MGETAKTVREAIQEVGTIKDTTVTRVSSLIVTKPYGVVEQDDFLNGAMEVRTLLTPEELLEELHRIEAEHGRERVLRWGPRTLDLDIIFYDDLVMDSEELTIPHIDMQNRDFVVDPMAEIAPYKRHPSLRKNNERAKRRITWRTYVELRNEIDVIDREIVDLFQKRMKISSRGGRIQDQHRKKGV